MAAHTHNPSRRALLGAAVAFPLVGASSPSSFPRTRESLLPAVPEESWTPDRVRGDGEEESRADARWRRLLARYRAAEGAVRAVEGDAAREEDYGDRLGDLYAVLRRLLCLPAPGIEAFAVKVVLAIDHELATLAGGEPCLAAIRWEAVRLAAEQKSNILFSAGPAMPK